MVPFQSEKGQNSSTKIVSFQKRVKNPQQKWYHFRRRSNIFNKNGTISGKGQKSSTKIVPFSQKKVKFLNKNGKNPSTNMVPFQKRVKHRQQKMVLFQKKDKMVNENGTILVRKGSKFLNKNGTISENGQKSSTIMVPFLKKNQNSSTKMVPFQSVKGQNSFKK